MKYSQNYGQAFVTGDRMMSLKQLFSVTDLYFESGTKTLWFSQAFISFKSS